MMKNYVLIFLTLLFFTSCSSRKVSLETLLLEIADREAIARYPDPVYSLKQFSSYDRATVAPGDHTWFANWDRSMFIRTDTISGHREYVMMDTEGPGAIVRFWMTFAGENAEKSDDITDPGAKTGGEAAYYNINYRTHPSGTKVTTWTNGEMTKNRELLGNVQQLLAIRDRGTSNLKPDSLTFNASLAPGAIYSDTLEGKRAIRMIRVTVNPSVDPQALRSTVLKVEFDGQPTVWAPLGDFFGTGYQLRHSNTWYSSVDPAGGVLTDWHVMPFKSRAVITLENFGKEVVDIKDITI